mgnify:CR=1 FL=1
MNLKNVDFLQKENLNQVKVFKNILDIKNDFNFNDILNLIQYSYFQNSPKYPKHTGININDIFSHTFQIFDVREFQKLNVLHKQFSVLFKKSINDEKFRPDIFFSFRSSTGPLHTDECNVFIIGLEGTTFYDFPSLKKIYEVNKTDAIFIPAKITHAATSIQKRIICSWSIFN